MAEADCSMVMDEVKIINTRVGQRKVPREKRTTTIL